MLVLGDIEILEHWCQVDSLNGNTLSVFCKSCIDACNFLFRHIKILSSGLDSVVNSHWSNFGGWRLLDAIRCESSVDTGAEINVIEFLISVFVSTVKWIILFSSQVEVKHGHDTLKLGLGDVSLSKFIEIEEEFFNSNSLHDNGMLESLDDIIWIIWNFNSLLHESVVDNI